MLAVQYNTANLGKLLVWIIIKLHLQFMPDMQVEEDMADALNN